MGIWRKTKKGGSSRAKLASIVEAGGASPLRPRLADLNPKGMDSSEIRHQSQRPLIRSRGKGRSVISSRPQDYFSCELTLNLLGTVQPIPDDSHGVRVLSYRESCGQRRLRSHSRRSREDVLRRRERSSLAIFLSRRLQNAHSRARRYCHPPPARNETQLATVFRSEFCALLFCWQRPGPDRCWGNQVAILP